MVNVVVILSQSRTSSQKKRSDGWSWVLESDLLDLRLQTCFGKLQRLRNAPKSSDMYI